MKQAALASVRVLFIVLLFLTAFPRPVQALDNADCFACHDDKTLVKTNAGGKAVSMNVNPAAYQASVHGSNQCVACHSDIKEVPHPDQFKAASASCSPCHNKDIATYKASVHGLLTHSGNPNTPDCADCHGTHTMAPMQSPGSPLNYSNLEKTCGKCHAQVLQDVQKSVHGKAMTLGLRDAPICTDCHADHQIEALKTASPMKIAEKVCSRCHASERINTRYSLSANRASTFFDSYHGLAARLGSARAANCASCHGYHKILPSSDPASMVNEANMVRTCRKCHPGANENFSLGKIHVDNTPAADIGNVVNRWVRWVYLALIVGVIGGMMVHNLLTFRRKLIIIARKKDRSVIRMNLAQRIQHWLLLVSFISLAITGFALKYPDGWMAFLVGSSEVVRRTEHRVAAVVMLLVALAHIAYLLFTREGRKLLYDLLPAKNDFTDLLTNLKYLLLPKAPKPQYPRFNYGEKAEYWAVVWGTVIMGITGVMIWFKMDMTHWLPRWVIEVATTIHFYEAILAVLAIIVWHFYHVIFDPDVYPNNTAWLDGRVSEEWYHEEHPLDREPLTEKQDAKKK
jgi:formate dehydrogenase gamma subunit